MIFYPAGLYNGERLALCSDEARLHFPFIAGLVNGCGRLQLSIPLILERAYQNFRRKPSKNEIINWIAEYRRNFLLYVYTAANGEVWGQLCGVPDNALPRYQTAADKRSPAPVQNLLEAFNVEYSQTKRKRAEASENFVDLSEHFGNLPKAAEDSENLSNISAGEDVGEDVGEEEILSSPSAPEVMPSGADSLHPRAGRLQPKSAAVTKPEPEPEKKSLAPNGAGNLPELFGSPAEKPKKPPVHPLYGALRIAIEEAAAVVDHPERWGPAPAGALATLLRKIPDRPEAFWRQCIASWTGSTAKYQTVSLATVIARLPEFSKGSKDDYLTVQPLRQQERRPLSIAEKLRGTA